MISRHLASLVVLTLAATTPAAAQSYPMTSSTNRDLGFAAGVAIGDGEIFVTEPNNRFRPGLVYAYGRGPAGTWEERYQLTSPMAASHDRFGRAIAVTGNSLAISSQASDSGAVGNVHLFTRQPDGTWKRADELHGPLGEQFGAALAFAGDELLVGAPEAGDSTGVIYRFRHSGSNWLPAGTIAPEALQPGNRFGSVLHVTGDHLFAGVPSRDKNTGGVLHFVLKDGAWVPAAPLTPGGGEEGDRFGAAIAVDGDRAWVSAPGHAGGVVATFSYNAERDRWAEGPPLQRFDGVRGTAFGTTLAASTDGLWIGAPGGGRTGGRLFLHRRGADGWTGLDILAPGESASDQGFGGTLAVRDDLAVVGITGSDLGAGHAQVWERLNGAWAPTALLQSPPEALARVTGDQVRCEDGAAAMWECDGVDLVSFLPVSEIGGVRGMRLNDLWGWTDSSSGREFVIIGRSDGTSFVEMTDPAHPRYLGDLPKTPGSRSAVWRDMKTYRNTAYIVADGAAQHGVQVFDLTRLRTITTPKTFEPDTLYTNIASAHNIVINEETGFAYVVGASSGGETCGGGLHMLSLADPAHPSFVGCYSDGITGRAKTGYSHDAQCVVYRGPDTDYTGHEICVGSNETALSLADVTDKAAPRMIATISYPKVAYTHQGWFSEDQRWFFSNDEIDEANGSVENTRTLVWDMADLDDPVLLTEYYSPGKATDHNLYVRGNFMYESNTGDGLRIIDISDPRNLREVGHFDTDPDGSGGGTWSNYPYFASGVIPVTGGYAGIFFVRKRDQLVP
jgi:choice-of-anchor B domain-containing protein